MVHTIWGPEHTLTKYYRKKERNKEISCVSLQKDELFNVSCKVQNGTPNHPGQVEVSQWRLRQMPNAYTQCSVSESVRSRFSLLPQRYAYTYAKRRKRSGLRSHGDPNETSSSAVVDDHLRRKQGNGDTRKKMHAREKDRQTSGFRQFQIKDKALLQHRTLHDGRRKKVYRNSETDVCVHFIV